MHLYVGLCYIDWQDPPALLGLLFTEERSGITELPFLSTFALYPSHLPECG